MTMYLLFNEGYYSASNDAVLRKDLYLQGMYIENQDIEKDDDFRNSDS
mgnify:CR=1 FL=1